MEKDFKVSLLALYPAYDRVTGPYLRADGRKHVVLNNSSLSTKDKEKLRTLSWPKALVEVREGRVLFDHETADHIDEDLSNDNLDNLQILSRGANIIKSFNSNPERFASYSKHNCPQCFEDFLVLDRQVRGNQLRQGKPGPFCSRVCSGKFNQSKQVNFKKSA